MAQQLEALYPLRDNPSSVHNSHSSQLPVTIAAGDLEPFYGLHRYLLLGAHAYTQTHVQIKLKIKY